MPAAVYSDPSPITAVPKGSPTAAGLALRFHRRVAVTNTAGTLGSFIAALGNIPAGIPTRTLPDGTVVYPHAVLLQVEQGSVGTAVYVSCDGSNPAAGGFTEVSATYGLGQLPVGQAWTRLPCPQLLQNDAIGDTTAGTIRLVAAAAGPIYLYATFEL